MNYLNILKKFISNFLLSFFLPIIHYLLTIFLNNILKLTKEQEISIKHLNTKVFLILIFNNLIEMFFLEFKFN